MIADGVTRFNDTNKKSSSLWINSDIGIGYNFQTPSPESSIMTVFAGPGTHWEKFGKNNVSWFYGMVGFKFSQNYSKLINFGFEFKNMYSFGVRQKFHKKIYKRNGFFGIEMGLPTTLTINEARNLDFCIKPYLLKFDIKAIGVVLGSTFELGWNF